MNKIINTFKYGDRKTKLILLLTICAGMGTVALMALFFVYNEMILFFGGIMCGFIMITLAQSFGIEQQNFVGAKPVKDSEIGNVLNNVEHSVKTEAEETEIEEEEPETEAEETEIKEEKPETEAEETEIKPQKTEKKIKKERKKKERTEKEKKAEILTDIENATVEEILETYTKKTIKKTMHRYRIKKDHRMAIIDNCKKLHIYQAPAYIWVSEKELNILVIEKEPRHLTIPVYSITEITYLKKYPGKEEDYALFKGNSLMANIFREYLPDYSYSTNVDDITPYKNLYGIGPDIYFTNNSAANLFDLLGVKFYVEDKVTTSNKANYFFKEIYKCNILLRDNVIDANGYADKVSGYLDDMAHSTISYNEFRDTLNLLIKNKLITQEFASHFSEIRDKISR